jgi:stage V sporulation protein G
VEITEVRIKLMDDSSERLQAFCSITFDDCFVVRDLKIIEGASGPFVAMPSRKLTSHCPGCGSKNHLRAPYCNQCGSRLKDDRAIKDADGRAKLYADIAHPINSSCRESIQNRVIEEFRLEQERAKQPGYVSRYDDFDIDIDDLAAARAKQQTARSESSPSNTAAAQGSEQKHVEQAHAPGTPHTKSAPAAPSTPAPASPSRPAESSGSLSNPHVKPHLSSQTASGPHTGGPQVPKPNEGTASRGEASSSANTGSEFGAGIF